MCWALNTCQHRIEIKLSKLFYCCCLLCTILYKTISSKAHPCFNASALSGCAIVCWEGLLLGHPAQGYKAVCCTSNINNRYFPSFQMINKNTSQDLELRHTLADDLTNCSALAFAAAASLTAALKRFWPRLEWGLNRSNLWIIISRSESTLSPA